MTASLTTAAILAALVLAVLAVDPTRAGASAYDLTHPEGD